ncbi:hypothetical protein [Chryseobacterium jejuense]|uniref:Uncharacterized protein n=1 Tax=Chryseobacterium jejuense TaxID=445960 RepID=A0A2X2VRH7_CHRJE|nr:hypothetical protein [Chryseobacterium jejuense]SDJ09064.1 hypothetical protein SAMN05421542_2606 [Chryseobacterium jejuense]SQB27843.1 Uncharacterised protein [Chryseobacterium jejuense]
MSRILITNDSFFDKDYNETFSYQEKYSFFGVNEGTSTLVAFYKDLLKPVVGDKVEETFRDFVLGKAQTEQIKVIFEQQIDETLFFIEPIGGRRYRSCTLVWKGKSYDMNLSLISPKSRMVEDFHRIVTIAEECLQQNKPMYLSID